ncbi:MAG: hypothetical protein WCO18_01480 [bacterium]
MLAEDDREVEGTDDRFRITLSKPAEWLRGLAQFTFDDLGDFRGKRGQFSQRLVTEQPNLPVIERAKVLEGRLRHAQGSIRKDALKVVIGEPAGVSLTQVRMGTDDTIEMLDDEPSVTRFIDRGGPERVTRAFNEELLKIEINAGIAIDLGQQVRVEQRWGMTMSNFVQASFWRAVHHEDLLHVLVSQGMFQQVTEDEVGARDDDGEAVLLGEGMNQAVGVAQQVQRITHQ